MVFCEVKGKSNSIIPSLNKRGAVGIMRVLAFTMVLLKSRSRSLFEIVVALFDHEGF